MKPLKKYLSILFVLGIITNGCIGDFVASDNTVNGTIYVNEGFEYQMPLTYNYILIKAGNYPILYLYNPPKFSMSVTSKPYDLNIMFPCDSTFYEEPSVIKYVGLNSSNPKLVDANYETTERFFNILRMDVYFPELKHSKQIYFKFISNDFFLQRFYKIYESPGTQYIQSLIFIPGNRYSISGKLLFLESTYENQKLVSFDKFGIKDITLDFHASNEIVFTESDLTHNPPEITSNTSVTFPQSSYPKSISLVLEFGGFNTFSELILYNTPNFSDILMYPILPIGNVRYKLHSTYETSHNVVLNKPAENWKYFEPGENVNLEHYNLIQSYSPRENAIVDSNSVFEISDNLPSGVYTYDIYRIGEGTAAGKCLRIITSRKRFLFSEFLMEGFEYIPGKRYLWNVKKYIGYNSMDEFVGKIYTVDKVPSALSQGRFFTIKKND